MLVTARQFIDQLGVKQKTYCVDLFYPIKIKSLTIQDFGKFSSQLVPISILWEVYFP